MKNLKKTVLMLLSTLTVSLGFMDGGLSAEENKEALEQRLQALKQENEGAEIATLKAQIAEEEKKKADRQGAAPTSESQSQPASDQSTVPQQEGDEKSKWVRERNRVEDQAKDKWDKIKKIF